MNQTKCWCGNTELDHFSDNYLRCCSCETLVATRISQSGTDRGSNINGYVSPHHEVCEKDGTIDVGVRADLVVHSMQWLNFLLNHKAPPAKVLDIGSPLGFFPTILRMAGFNVTRLDATREMTENERNVSGIPSLSGPIEEQQIAPGSLDVITLMNVLEDFPDPVATVTHCLELLKPEGLLLVQSMRHLEYVSHEVYIRNKHTILLKVLNENGHPYIFSENSVCRMLEQLGCKNLQFDRANLGYPANIVLLTSRAPLEPTNVESNLARICGMPYDYLAKDNERLAKLLKNFESKVAAQQGMIQELEKRSLLKKLKREFSRIVRKFG